MYFVRKLSMKVVTEQLDDLSHPAYEREVGDLKKFFSNKDSEPLLDSFEIGK